MIKSVLVFSALGFFTQSAFAATYHCTLKDTSGPKLTGNIDTNNARSFLNIQDSATGLLLVCAALADNTNHTIGAIACGVLTPNGDSEPTFQLQDKNVVTSLTDTSWEAIGYASDSAPMTGISFNIRSGTNHATLSANCSL